MHTRTAAQLDLPPIASRLAAPLKRWAWRFVRKRVDREVEAWRSAQPEAPQQTRISLLGGARGRAPDHRQWNRSLIHISVHPTFSRTTR